MNPRITIAIPTYNRAQDLKTALTSVFRQAGLAAGDPRIEVLVSDNASSDETEATVEALRKDCPWTFLSSRNQENLGFSGNLQAIFEKARGDYVFLLSDDDALEEFCLQRVLDELEANPGVVVVNASVRDSELDKVLVDRLYQQFSGADRRDLANGEELFREAGWLAMPLVTGHVVRRAAWLACPPLSGISSICLHIFRTLRILGDESARVIAEPLVLYRTDNAEGRWNQSRGYPFNFQFDVMEGWKACKRHYSRKFYREYFLALRPTIITHLREAKLAGRTVDLGHFFPRLLRAYDLGLLLPFREVGLALVAPAVYKVSTEGLRLVWSWARAVKRKLGAGHKGGQ